MSVITPTIGRKIYVRLGLTAFDVPQPPKELSAQPFDATIVHVNEDGTINVAGKDHLGAGFSALSLPVLDAEPELVAGSYAFWMPYQVQAANEATLKAAQPNG